MVMFVPVSTDRAQITVKVIDEINKRAKGELVIDLLGGPEVVPPFEQGIAVKKGSVDISMLPTAFYEGMVPVGDILLLSRVTTEEERERGAWDYLGELHEKAGLAFLGRCDVLYGQHFFITLRKPAATPYDLAGRKLGLAGVHVKGFSKALGMAMISLPPPEAYTAAERGVIDAFSTKLDTQVTYGVYEAMDYCIDHPYFWCNTAYIMNLDSWNRLPNHLKDLVQDTIIDMEPVVRPLYDDLEAKYRQVMIDAGIEFIKFSPADAEWFVETAYRAEWERVTEQHPEVAPILKEMFLD